MNEGHSKTEERKIEAIIFDLGQVIVEVNHEKTYCALEKICNVSQDKIKEIFKREDYFLFELGKISEHEFFLKTKHFLTSKYGDTSSIAEAWDEMIVGIPQESVLLLKKLKGTLPIFALSNTNCSHVKVINKHLFNNHNIKDIRELFDKVYYSHELKLGKPDKKIFEHVLTDTKLASQNTIFIDDNLENILVARELGFQTIHLVQQNKLEDELKKVGVVIP